MSRSLLVYLTLAIILLEACSSNEIGNSRDVNPESIYFDYKVWGEEGREDMTVMLQFRFAGENGTTLVLEDPSKVTLDGEEFRADSSRMTGAFYELAKAVPDFIGKHRIVFTDINKKQYEEEFNFQPIRLRTSIPDTIQRGDMVLDVDGVQPYDLVRVLVADTAFSSEGINRVDTVKNGQILISKKDLKSVVNGPIHLELIREEERSVKGRTKEGGVISISYGIKRDFQMRDSL